MNNNLKRKIQLYSSSVLIYSIGIIIFRYLPYYNNYLSSTTQQTLLYAFLSFIILSPFYYLTFSKNYSTNKPFLFIRGCYKYFKNLLRTNEHFKLEKEEKVAFLFILVKLFFLPLMINFFYSNFNHLIYLKDHFNLYAFTLTLIFTLDTLIFAFGYTFEFRFLKNIVKSVEPTIFGWAVALASYPPFNGFIGSYVSWGANDYVIFGGPILDIVMKSVVIMLLLIYLSASFALGTKASNLTNRGIVGKFPYSIVRHPAYISKNLVWWITLLPMMNLTFALGMLLWSTIYFFRAMTEEKHLLQDPDYKEYCKKVKWRFIPRVF